MLILFPIRSLDYSSNQYSPEFLEYNGGSAQYAFIFWNQLLKDMNSACRVHFHTDSGAIHTSLPDGTSHLHQLHIIHGMNMTLDQAIQMCGGQWDIPGHCELYSCGYC